MQRLTARLLPVLGVALLGACAANRIGPSSDDRLDMATASVPSGSIAKKNAEHLARIQAASCEQPAAALAQLEGPGESEEGRLAGLTGLLRDLRARRDGIDQVLGDHPGLAYYTGKAADGVAYDIPALVQTCRNTLIHTEGSLDTLIRDVLAVPIVTEFEGQGRRRREVPKARVDFDLLEASVRTLSPMDQDGLVADIAAAKERLEKEKAEAKRPRRRRGRRRR